MEIIDYHVHSNNSFDGKDSIESICRQAIENGIKEICFTEHFSVDPRDVSYKILDYKKYHSEIEVCKDIFYDRLIIKEGLEIGEPHLKEYREVLNSQLEEMNLDYIIGSIHNIKGEKLRKYMTGKSKQEVYAGYFNELYNLVNVYNVNVVGHFDLIKRYAFSQYGNYDFNEYSHIIEKILKKIIESNMGIEINTSGLRNQCKEIFPSIEILKMYKQLGGEIITIGSDAHCTDDVGSECFYGIELLKNMKFDKIYEFSKGKPMAISIK